LRQLPTRIDRSKGLFSDAIPTDDGWLGAEFNETTVLDDVVVGLLPGEGVTPQYEIARVVAEQKDLFEQGMNEARALQLGLGTMTAEPGGVRGQSPRAAAADLDRLGEQYGIGRPGGFTDCCYWRLLWLMLFAPGGPTLWKLREICALYTGIRPLAVETPCKIVFIWPDASDSPGYCDQSYADLTCWCDGASVAPLDVYATHGFVSGGGVAKTYNYYLGTHEYHPMGMTLAQALAMVKAAGVYISLQNPPDDGAGGCQGATWRSYEDALGTFYAA
jgi:hypothetical protein